MTKFTSALAERLYSETPDDSVGSVQELGWFGLYAEEKVILEETPLGNVVMYQFGNSKDVSGAWRDVSLMYEEFEDDD